MLKDKLTVINLFGGPGAGKSKVRAGLFNLMKESGINCEEVTEYAKDLTWEEEKSKLSDQLYILAKQNRKLERLRGKVDVVITDSPLILCLNYVSLDYFPKNFQKLVWEIWDSYGNINYYLMRTGPYNPIGRNQSKAEAEEIDSNITKLLSFNDVGTTFVKGDSTAHKTIFDDIEKLFQRMSYEGPKTNEG